MPQERWHHINNQQYPLLLVHSYPGCQRSCHSCKLQIRGSMQLFLERQEVDFKLRLFHRLKKLQYLLMDLIVTQTPAKSL